MDVGDYTQALAQVIAELEKELREKEIRDMRIANLERAKSALSALCGQPNPTMQPWVEAILRPSINFSAIQAIAGLSSAEDIGLTDAVRGIFLANPTAWVTATQLKEQLDAQPFDWSTYSQPMSALHTVLKRLRTTFLDTKIEDGKTLYKRSALSFRRRRLLTERAKAQTKTE